jgi:hypothetical protein
MIVKTSFVFGKRWEMGKYARAMSEATRAAAKPYLVLFMSDSTFSFASPKMSFP